LLGKSSSQVSDQLLVGWIAALGHRLRDAQFVFHVPQFVVESLHRRFTRKAPLLVLVHLDRPLHQQSFFLLILLAQVVTRSLHQRQRVLSQAQLFTKLHNLLIARLATQRRSRPREFLLRAFELSNALHPPLVSAVFVVGFLPQVRAAVIVLLLIIPFRDLRPSAVVDGECKEIDFVLGGRLHIFARFVIVRGVVKIELRNGLWHQNHAVESVLSLEVLHVLNFLVLLKRRLHWLERNLFRGADRLVNGRDKGSRTRRKLFGLRRRSLLRASVVREKLAKPQRLFALRRNRTDLGLVQKLARVIVLLHRLRPLRHG